MGWHDKSSMTIGNKFIGKSIAKKRVKKTADFYYTSPEMVKALLGWLDLNSGLSTLDAGSGRNKVWFKCLTSRRKFECEIEDGNDFYLWEKAVDWVVGNPPFSEGWRFLEKASQVAKKGIAFLGNINFFSSLTPRRLQILKDNGFSLSRIRITQDKRWFGRYYFIVFEKKPNKFIVW